MLPVSRLAPRMFFVSTATVGLATAGLATARLAHVPAGGLWRAPPHSPAASLLHRSHVATMQETGQSESKITIRKPGRKSTAASAASALTDDDMTVTVKVSASASLTDESTALKALVRIVSSLKRFGLDGDQRQSDSLAAAVNTLYGLLPAESSIAMDPRLVGEWLLVGTTSQYLISRKGLTSLGAAPCMNLCTLHVSFTAEGKVTTKEVLENFGEPIILNELRGTISFTEGGDSMLESYDTADMGGEANSPAFNGVEFALYESAITSCGEYRLGRDDGTGVYIFKKMREGVFTEYLDEKQLPTSGGTYNGNPTWKGCVETQTKKKSDELFDHFDGAHCGNSNVGSSLKVWPIDSHSPVQWIGMAT